MKVPQDLPKLTHFRLEQLADGVYAAIHMEGGAVIGIAGIVWLGDRTLIYDPFMSPQAAQDLRTVAEMLFDRPIDTVINSHRHNDHIWGNQAFSADTDIVGTGETRRLIIATKGHGAFDALMVDAKANLESTRAQLQAAVTERQRRELSLWVDYHQSVVATKPILRVRALGRTDRL